MSSSSSSYNKCQNKSHSHKHKKCDKVIVGRCNVDCEKEECYLVKEEFICYKPEIYLKPRTVYDECVRYKHRRCTKTHKYPPCPKGWCSCPC